MKESDMMDRTLRSSPQDMGLDDKIKEGDISDLTGTTEDMGLDDIKKQCDIVDLTDITSGYGS